MVRNINHYVTFVEVYECKSFSEAAINLNLSQPTVSYSVKTLEKHLKTRLFYPHRRGVSASLSAVKLYPIIKSAIKTLTSADETIWRDVVKKRLKSPKLFASQMLYLRQEPATRASIRRFVIV